MKLLKITIPAIALLALLGCGPEKSELDLERERSDQRISQKANEIAEVEGAYTGVATYKGKELCHFRLNLSKVYENNPSSPDAPEVAIKGVASLYAQDQEIPISFPSVKYYPTQNLIVLVGKFLVGNGGEAYFNIFKNGAKGFVGHLTSSQAIPVPGESVQTMTIDVVLEKIN